MIKHANGRNKREKSKTHSLSHTHTLAIAPRFAIDSDSEWDRNDRSIKGESEFVMIVWLYF